VKSIYICFLFIFLFLHCEAQSESTDESVPEYTIMIYVEADDILNPFAVKNFNAIATIDSSKKMNVIVQWNQPRQAGTWRYKIEKDKMTVVDKNIRGPKRSVCDDLVDFAQFAHKNYRAKNYILILWNHGLGILEPSWDQLPYFFIQYHQEIKGILYDTENKTYLSNNALKSALNEITTNVIKKKFAIIGMDACLMSMLEVCYQVKDYADYLVAAEEVELAKGWNYASFLGLIAQKPETPPEKIATQIVKGFENLYKNRTKYYSLAAVDLRLVDRLKENLDLVVQKISFCKKTFKLEINAAVVKARKSCFQLSIASYIDLHSFYSKLKKYVCKLLPANHPGVKSLISNLSFGIELINKAVITSVASDYFSKSKGISIYFPPITKSTLSYIDPSYLKTAFAQSCGWLHFLEKNVCL